MSNLNKNEIRTVNDFIAAATTALARLDFKALSDLEDILGGWFVDGETRETLNGLINAMQDAVEEQANS